MGALKAARKHVAATVKKMRERTKKKGKIQLQVDAMQVSLAAKRAKGKKAGEVAEMAEVKTQRIKQLAKVKKLQKSLLAAKLKSTKARKAAAPLLKKEVSTKARIQKLGMEVKLADVDLSEPEKTQERAAATYVKAKKDKDEKVMAAA